MRGAGNGPLPSRRGRRSQSERREEAERRMLAAAVRIVAERGLDDLTLAACGEAAGYSRGLAGHYFGSREALVASIAQHIVGEYTRRVRRDGAGRRGLAGLLDGVEHYIGSGEEDITTLRALYAVLGAALVQPSVASAIAALNRRSAAGFAALVRDGMRRGEIRADVDAQAQGVLILAALRGVMTQWLLAPESVDLSAVRAQFVADLHRALRAEGEGV